MGNGVLRRARTAGIGIAILTAAVATAPAFAATRSTSAFPLNPDLKLQRVRVSSGPEEIRILTVTPGSAAAPDIAPATQQYPMWAPTSTMSSRAGAIAGVNGDFGTGKGQPSHTLMIDGELWTTGQSGGNAVAWSSNGKQAYLGHPVLKIRVDDGAGAGLFNIVDWNVGTPTGTNIGAFTSRGGTVTKPPGKASPANTDPRWCAARLEPVKAIGWSGPARVSLVRTYTVATQPEPCPRTPLAVGDTPGAVVVASKYRSTTPNKVMALKLNDTVRISWTFEGWPGVTDVMGGSQMLVDRGANVAPDYTAGADYILNYNPRSSVGITRGCSDTDAATVCKLLLITIDGRQASTNWSKGVRLPFLANEHIRAGAWMAMNMDGGGSTTMWVKKKDPAYCQSSPNVGGCLAQRPSSSLGERSTRTAIIVLPSADTGTPSALR